MLPSQHGDHWDIPTELLLGSNSDWHVTLGASTIRYKSFTNATQLWISAVAGVLNKRTTDVVISFWMGRWSSLRETSSKMKFSKGTKRWFNATSDATSDGLSDTGGQLETTARLCGDVGWNIDCVRWRATAVTPRHYDPGAGSRDRLRLVPNLQLTSRRPAVFSLLYFLIKTRIWASPMTSNSDAVPSFRLTQRF